MSASNSAGVSGCLLREIRGGGGGVAIEMALLSATCGVERLRLRRGIRVRSVALALSTILTVLAAMLAERNVVGMRDGVLAATVMCNGDGVAGGEKLILVRLL